MLHLFAQLCRIGLISWSLLAVLAVVPGMADEPEFILSPQLQLGAGYDSNYRFDAPGGAVDSLTGQVETGLLGAWLPSIRSRWETRQRVSFTGYRPFGGNGLDRAWSWQGLLSWLYLTGLHSGFAVDAGAYHYMAPKAFESLRTNGTWIDASAYWDSSDALRLEWSNAVWLSVDRPEPDLNDLPRRDLEVLSRLQALLRPSRRLHVELMVEGGLNRSDPSLYRYWLGRASLGSRIEIWAGGYLNGRASLRRRWYDMSTEASHRVDNRLRFSLGIMQALARDQWLRSVWERTDHYSSVIPYSRDTFRVLWEYEPSWSF